MKKSAFFLKNSFLRDRIYAKNEKSREARYENTGRKDKCSTAAVIKKINFTTHTYQTEPVLSGAEIAKILGENPDKVFKTLVTVGKSNANYVFVVPVEKELDLKAAAAVVGEKSISMIKSKELLPLTGYIHGGCSPIGMKKFFPTVIDESAKIRKLSFSAAAE